MWYLELPENLNRPTDDLFLKNFNKFRFWTLLAHCAFEMEFLGDLVADAFVRTCDEDGHDRFFSKLVNVWAIQ